MVIVSSLNDSENIEFSKYQGSCQYASQLEGIKQLACTRIIRKFESAITRPEVQNCMQSHMKSSICAVAAAACCPAVAAGYVAIPDLTPVLCVTGRSRHVYA